MQKSAMLTYVDSFVVHDVHRLAVMTRRPQWYAAGRIIETALKDARIRAALGLDGEEGAESQAGH